jgi:flagellar biosynthesis GTPase FlhF
VGSFCRGSRSKHPSASDAATRAPVKVEPPRKEPKPPQPPAEPLNLERELERRGTNNDRRIDVLLSEMEDLKRSMNDLGRSNSARSESFGGLYAELTILGIDSALAEELVTSASDRDASPAEVRKRVRSMLAERIMIDAPRRADCKIPIGECVCRSHGVGKTTTIAKLAAQASALYNKKVALITYGYAAGWRPRSAFSIRRSAKR